MYSLDCVVSPRVLPVRHSYIYFVCAPLRSLRACSLGVVLGKELEKYISGCRTARARGIYFAEVMREGMVFHHPLIFILLILSGA